MYMLHKNVENQRRLKKLAYQHGSYKPGTVYYSKQLGRYIKTWRGSRSKFIKSQCNKRLRRYKGELKNGGQYKKATEFWWELY